MTEKPQPETEDSLLTRRQVVASLAATGAIGTVGATLQSSEDGSTNDVGIGGGPMSDEASHLAARVYRGTADNLPDPGVENRFYYVTTGNTTWNADTLLVDTGTAWEKQSLEVESLSTEASHTKKRPRVDVTQWGAEGDGATIDDDAFRDAIDEVVSTGYPLYVPATNDYYLIDSLELDGSVNDYDNLEVIGDGRASHVRQQTDPSSGFLWYMTNVSGVTMRNLRFSHAGADNLRFDQSDEITLEDINSHNAQGPNGDGIEINTSSDVVVERPVTWDNGQDSVHATTGSENVVVSDGRSFRDGQNSAYGGFGANESDDIVFDNCRVFDSQSTAFYSREAGEVTYKNPRVDGAAEHAILNAGTKHCTTIKPTVKGVIGSNQTIRSRSTGNEADPYTEIIAPTIEMRSAYSGDAINYSDGRGKVHGGEIIANGSDGTGVKVRDDDVVVANVEVEGIGTGGEAVQTIDTPENVRFQSLTLRNNATAFNLFEGADVQIDSPVLDGNSTDVSDGSGNTRPRWNGIIGGGPLGGIDTSTVDGRDEGDLAIDSGDLNLYRWDGAAWNAV